MHHAAPGVVKQIARMDQQAIFAKDGKGRSLIEIAVAVNAPSWILHELYEANPDEVQNICLLRGNWPATKAATEVMRMISNRHQDHNKQWQQMMKAPSHKKAPTATKVRSLKDQPQQQQRPPEGEQRQQAAIEAPKSLAPEVENGVQEESMCEVGCSIS